VTGPRVCAHARVAMTLQHATLRGPEQAEIRHVADALLFCADLRTDVAARTELARVEALLDRLVSTGRWSAGHAAELERAVYACGPGEA
jgi:hypothetical protein